MFLSLSRPLLFGLLLASIASAVTAVAVYAALSDTQRASGVISAASAPATTPTPTPAPTSTPTPGPPIFAWGSNVNGQLGDASSTDRLTPVQVIGLTGAAAIAGGTSYSVAVKTGGTLWVWGGNEYGDNPAQVGGATGFEAAAAGWRLRMALKSDGTLWAWGNNNHGQLGDGSTTDSWTNPVQVTGLTGVVAFDAGRHSETHALAVKSDGTVWAWGENFAGQLGEGTTNIRSAPSR